MDPQLQESAAFVRRVHELRAIRRPGGIRVERLIVRNVLWRATDVHDVNVAKRCEGNGGPVRWDLRAHDAERLARHGRRKIAWPTCVLRPRHWHRSGELDRL